VVKRPSIEELLEVPVVAGRRMKMERKMSDQHKNSGDLRTWEKELRALEEELEEKKRELESMYYVELMMYNPVKITIELLDQI